MSGYSKVLLLVVAAIAATMVLPGVSALPIAGASAAAPATVGNIVAPATVSPSALHTANTAGANAALGTGATGTLQERVLANLRADHVPMTDAFLPNFGAQVSTQGGHISPLYTSSPAPTGIGDFGVQEVNGHDVGTISYTDSVKASVTLNHVEPIYVTSSAPDEFTMQLNTVMTNVDLFGNDSYQFWIQNVPIYQPSTQTLSFEDNIWNFSSPSFYFSANSVYAHGPGGVVAAPELYFAQGPSYYMPTPFTVYAYNNVTVAQGRSTVFFNYTVVPSNGNAFSGSYDFVEFNSTPETTGVAPAPDFQINGKAVGDTNFLLNDAEIMLGGPGGGSTTTLFDFSGGMGLWVLPNGTSTYQTVPSAYDFGTDTGETSEGIAEYATTGANPTAVLSSGPAMLYPLWGLKGAQQGEETITLNLSPSNAFVFASPGPKFEDGTAAWGPTRVSGPTSYHLAPGTYSFRFLLADHTPQAATYTSGGTWTVTLASNPKLGDYTPLWAESNGQLAAISQPGGAGTISDPYFLDNGPAVVNSLFGEANDYDFPVFPGIYLIHTSAYVDAFDLPSFTLTYNPSEIIGARLSLDGLPLSNQLNIETFDVTHLSIVDSPSLSGWFFTDIGFGEPASIYLWDSSYNLIAGNTFYVESNGINVVNGGHNWIWGNVFYPQATTASDPGAILNDGLTPAIWEFESNDRIFDNAFLTPITAISPPENFYTGAPQINLDWWNVPVQPASDVFVVNGWFLSGSILGLSWVGGNYWWNYGTATDPYGVLPYTDGGAIFSGGDYHPLTPTPLYEVRFVEHGLTAGTTWSATLNGYTQSTNTTLLIFWEPAGTYAYTIGTVAGHTAKPGSGAVTVTDLNQTVYIHFRR